MIYHHSIPTILPWLSRVLIEVRSLPHYVTKGLIHVTSSQCIDEVNIATIGSSRLKEQIYG